MRELVRDKRSALCRVESGESRQTEREQTRPPKSDDLPRSVELVVNDDHVHGFGADSSRDIVRKPIQGWSVAPGNAAFSRHLSKARAHQPRRAEHDEREDLGE